MKAAAPSGELLTVAKALGDENRLRALALLEGRELCLCQVVEVLGLAVSGVSRHMAILHRAGLVEGRKQGRWAYFRLAGEDASPAVRGALRLVLESFAADPRGKEDRRTLKAVLKLEPEELCRRQSGCC
ncbi:MAG: ArsR/SmtB family transcription factor [Lacipirellulaceae bacterium]